MTWKRIGLCLVAVLVAALIYPGIPVGGALQTISSSSEAHTEMTCYSLHWYGLHRKEILIQHDPRGPINATNEACWRPPY